MPDAKVSTIRPGADDNARSSNANQHAVKAYAIEVKKRAGTTASGMSTAISQDPFESLTSEGKIIEPPFDMLTLAMLPEHNTEMGQCIEAMETNIEGFGHRFVPRVKLDHPDITPPLKAAVHKEHVFLDNFFMYATMDVSYVEHRRRLRCDLETTGNAYIEVIRGATGAIQGFVHIPSYQMRLGLVEDEPVEVDWPILEKQLDDSVKIVNVRVWKRFRMFAQSKSIQLRNLSVLGSHKMRWFKEFGDERIYDNTTGDMVQGSKAAGLPINRRANEIIHLKLYSTRSPYGLPRYIGNLLSIFGDRASEEINYVTFKNHNIPSMVIMVSNGQLTEGSVQRITDFVESQIQGSDNYSKFLVLEAEGLLEGEDGAQVKMEIKPLVKEQHKDALFQQYSHNNQDKVRRVWRLPPIFVGRTDDYTRTTAESSRRLADEQIFAPERDDHDNLVNRVLFPHMGILYHKFKSNSPNTTDNAELTKILAGGEKTGGVTPRIARDMLEDILGKELPAFPADFPQDIPFSMTLAEAVKNKADPTEPGQQVTALKKIEQLTTSQTEDASDGLFMAECGDCGNQTLVHSTDAVSNPIDQLFEIRKQLEKRWKNEVLGDEIDTEV